MKRMKLFASIGILLAMFLTTAACGFFGGIGGGSATLTVLAGSELKDIEPLLDQIERETDVRLEFTYIGTLNGAEELLAGAQYDLAWFSHAKYLAMLDESGLIATEEKIMLSPVVLGVKQSKADAFGWTDNPNVSWRDIAEKAESGELRFAMTNPAASNSGFTALVGVAAAFAGGGDAFNPEDVDQAAMQSFFKGQTLTAGSSGWLAENYIGAQDTLDGLINYESVLLAMNEGMNDAGRLRERLTLIYPQEGIITADYPIMLLNGDQREAYDRLAEYLRTPGMQETLMKQTLRRPAIPGVTLDSRIPDSLLVELPFPSRISVVDTLLFSYLDEQRVPAHAFFVIDVSGSMEGDGIRDLKAAINNLTGLDTSLTGRFSRFRNRERVTLIPFNHEMVDNTTFTIGDVDSQGGDMAQIRGYVETLYADGGTAIYSTLAQAYEMAGQAKAADRNRYYTIVVMSDGENRDGIELRQFEHFYDELPENVQNIRTFAVTFGDADESAMQAIAETTSGRMFDGKKQSLSSIFKQIRGYQ